MTPEQAAFLTSARALERLPSVSAKGETLRVIEDLRAQGFSAAESGWLLEQADLRERAGRKLREADKLLLTREALEQASPEEVSRWRSEPLAGRRIVEVGAGVGGDTLAMARAGARVEAHELDPARAALLRHNVEALGLSERVSVHVGDALAAGGLAARLASEAEGGAGRVDLVYADPARRVEGRRLLGLEEGLPPLSALRAACGATPLWVKAAPGLPLHQVPEDASLTFVSLRGELKEALLRFNEGDPGARAVRLDEAGAHELSGASDLPPRVAPLGAYLHEPDPSVTRSGLIRTLAREHDAWQLHAKIATLSSDAPLASPFARSFRVLSSEPFQRKRLKRAVRAANAKQVIVKERGTRVNANELERWLPRGDDPSPLWVFLLRLDKTVLAVLARASAASPSGRERAT